VSHFSVNGSGDLASITDPTNTITFQGTYDASHRLTQTTDRAGGTWKYVYDAASKLASDSTPSVKADMTISGTGSLTTARLGASVRSLEMTILPASGKGTSSNPADQRVSSSVRAVTFAITGDSTKYAMDRFGGATQIETPTLRDTTFITRDAAGRVLSSLERTKGTIVQNVGASYSGPRLTAQSNALAGSSIVYTYDTTYDLVTNVSGSTPPIQNYLNAAKTLVDSSHAGAAANPASRFKYDAKGRDTLVIDPQSDTRRYYYGSTGFQNTDSVYTGLNPTVFRHDTLFGRVVGTVNAKRDSSVATLDLLNRVQSVRAQGGATTSYAYDSLGRVRQITDPKGQVYAYHMNALGWADTVTDAASTKNIADRRDIFEFTKTGAIRAHIDRNHWRTSHVFDRWGRDSVLTYTDARGSTRTTTFAYDTAGLWSAAANSESIDTVRTDSAGLTQIQTTWRGATRYVDTTTSDATGLLRSKVLMTGTGSPTTVQRITYGYDTNLWMQSLTVAGDSTRFYHNADGVLTAIKHMTHAGTKIDSIAYTISTVHQGVTATHSAAGLSSFNSAYARDSLGRITQRSLADTMWNYTYDAHGQLTKYAALTASDSLLCVKDPHYMDGEHCTVVGSVDTLRSQAFSYDSVGNRTDNSPTILAGNRLTSWIGYTLAYDSAGNLVHKSKTGFDQYLYWNSLGQLDSAKTNGVLVSFGYDGFGRRARKTDSTVVLKYIYDGAQLATIDSAGTPVQTFTFYPGSENPHSVQRSTGNRQYYVTEIGAGSVWGLTDSTAAVKNHYRYAPFGLLEDSSEVVKSPLRFTGREYDHETRLYFNRARYYDPELARFISEDPIGQNGGANQYAYVANDPVNATDPSGTCLYEFHWYSDMDGGPCSKGGGNVIGGANNPTSLGNATDFPMSWGDWESLATPAGCSQFDASKCAQVKTAINQLQNSGEQHCEDLGINAAYRLNRGSLADGGDSPTSWIGGEEGSVQGVYYSPAAVRAKFFMPADSWTEDGLIYLYSGAFERGSRYLFGVLAHEEAHAVLGVDDGQLETGAKLAGTDPANPATGWAVACQGMYDSQHN
jgi:RHS repeat-associated protein